MKIQVDAGALRSTKWSQYLLRFFFGGLVTVLAGIIAKKFGPVVGGLFLAFPAIFPASATLVDKHEKEKKLRAGLEPGRRGNNAVALDAAGATMGGLGLVIFAILLWSFLPRYGSSAGVIALGAVVWAAVSVGIWRVCEYL